MHILLYKVGFTKSYFYYLVDENQFIRYDYFALLLLKQNNFWKEDSEEIVIPKAPELTMGVS